MLILIADDNKQICNILGDYCIAVGYDIAIAHNGKEVIEKFNTIKPDLILLDVMMPIIDGYRVCEKIRESSNVPIIMITAKGEDYERIMGLDTGADDYVVKPFSPDEVMARIRAISRRIGISVEELNNVVNFDNLKINIENYQVYINGILVNLTKKELELLWVLASNKNKVFTRDNLLDSIWGFDYIGDNRTVDTHIKRMRAKLDKHEHKNWEVKTIWGVGYKFEVIDNEE